METLSDKRFNGSEVGIEDNVYGEGDVKEFIKKFKKEIMIYYSEKGEGISYAPTTASIIIDKLAGDKLT